MAAELLEFDPVDQDAANSPLSVSNSSYKVTAYSWPAPQLNVLYASSVDTEGEIPASRRYSNRQISMTLTMTDTTGNLLSALQAKVAKIAREGGTLKRTMKNGDVIVFDLLAADAFDPKFDVIYHIKDYLEVEVAFAAMPFGRGTEVTLSAHPETSLPCLTFTETAITGDVPALGRLTITEAQAADQAFVIWGQQSRYYDSSSDAALFYQAESRTPLTSAATAVGATGASGTGSNVVRHTNLNSSFQGIVSTQATGAGNHLKHVGDFNVLARVYMPASNAGTVTVALEWAEGDFRAFTRNTPVALDPTFEANWMLIDLGQVHLTKVVAGTQRWEGRVLGKSGGTGDEVDVDCLMLVPVAEGSGRVTASSSTPSPATLTAQSNFTTESGVITGDSLTAGGTWSGSGDADDFSVSGGLATRTAVSDSVGLQNGRMIVASGSTLAGCSVAVSAYPSAVETTSIIGTTLQGVLARYVDTSNFLAAGFRWIDDGGGAAATCYVYGRVGGTTTELAQDAVSVASVSSSAPANIQLTVTTGGVYTLTISFGSGVTQTLTGSLPALAPSGALASGKCGLIDYWSLAGANTRTFSGFQAWAAPGDAAMFASQSLEVRSDRVVREDSGGTLWVNPSSYEGDYLLVPPAGAEARTNRFFVKGSRGIPGESADSGIDDISATLSFTPRYLVVP